LPGEGLATNPEEKMSLYESYGNTEEEIYGVKITVDENTRITIARAGGLNKKFESIKASILKPYQRRILAGKLKDDELKAILLPAYAKTVIKNWETKVDDEWKIGIEGKNSILPFNHANIIKVLTDLPDLYDEIVLASSQLSTFNKFNKEEDLKN
jgi:hypothetical protein